MSNVIALLFKLNWDPISFEIWQNNNTNEQYALTCRGMCTKPLIQDLVNSLNTTQYLRASEHYDGAGIEYGVDWHTTLCLLHGLRKHKLNACVGALETVLAGACWPESRVHQAFPHVPETCSLCGRGPANSMHVFWGCEIINNWDLDVIRSTQPLIARALNEGLRYPCLWIRGIMPHNLTSVPQNTK